MGMEKNPICRTLGADGDDEELAPRCLSQVNADADLNAEKLLEYNNMILACCPF